MTNKELDLEQNKALNLKESLKRLEVIKSNPVRISLNLTPFQLLQVNLLSF